MRLVSARLVGLKGIYSKSGKREVFIDFTKCKHSLIYIIGRNGSGKSTLLNALNPLPDSPQMYLDGEFGEKEITYAHENCMYRINIQYPVYTNGGRAATKAFFTEIDENGVATELNTNGTVNSYKDTLFTKFNMDPNFESLSYLSIENKGLVEKKPAERKKFVAGLLQSIEAYNNIYKTLVKRSAVFKSLINSITAKIDSTGDEQKLIIDKSVVDSRLATLQQQKQILEARIASAQATIQVIDPDNLIQTKYKKLASDLSVINDNLTLLRSATIPSIDGVESLDDANNMFMELVEIRISLKNEIDTINNYIEDMLIDREEDAKRIFVKKQKCDSLMDGKRVDDLKAMLREYRSRIIRYENVFKKLGVSGDIITKDEYVMAIRTLQDIRYSVDSIRSYASETDIEQACEYLLDGKDPVQVINSMKQEIDKCKEDMIEYKSRLMYFRELDAKVKILEGRPKSCKIDTCSFIADALEAVAKDPQKNIDMYQTLVSDCQKKQDMFTTNIEVAESINRVYIDLKALLSSIRHSSAMLSKFPNMERFIDPPLFLGRVQVGDPFNDIYDLCDQMDAANVFELYTNDKKVLRDLEAEDKIAQAQESVIEELQSEMADLVKKLDGIDARIEERRKIVSEKQKQLLEYEEIMGKLDEISKWYQNIEHLEGEKQEIESQLSTVSHDIEKISNGIATINKATSQLHAVIAELNPLSKSKDDISFALSKLAEYRAELDDYNNKYSLIELLKKYSSPTKGGIQTIFMQLYMDKTLSLSNQLLSMLFDGELEILPYVINENEFRIPVKNSITNLITDDVSNCSTSEKSMIAMIMGLSLMVQSSSIYNIIKFDEIDDGLDQSNKSTFPIIQSKMMELLNVENCINISHASEIDMSNVDIISLTPVSHETLKGNVIFQL